MDKRGRAEDKGKKQRDDLIGIIKEVAVTPSFLFVGLRTALWAVACAPLSPHPWSPRASLVLSISSLLESRWRGVSFFLLILFGYVYQEALTE